MTRNDWLHLARKTKVMVDLEMPGYEWGNLEAVLNGAVLIPAAHGPGRNHRDYDITDDQKIFLDGATPCKDLGIKIGMILSQWRRHAENQNGFRRNIRKMRNLAPYSMLSFFQDDVVVVMSGLLHKSYELSYSVAFSGLFSYPHASYEVMRYRRENTYFDFNAAFDFINDFVGVGTSSFLETSFATHFAHDDAIFLAPVTSRRLYIVFLPVGYFPVSKNIFGFLATELERRNHRHWLICKETGLIFARQWWYNTNQEKLIAVTESILNAKPLKNSTVRIEIFKTAFGELEVEKATIEKGRIRSFGFFLQKKYFQ